MAAAGAGPVAVPVPVGSRPAEVGPVEAHPPGPAVPGGPLVDLRPGQAAPRAGPAGGHRLGPAAALRGGPPGDGPAVVATAAAGSPRPPGGTAAAADRYGPAVAVAAEAGAPAAAVAARQVHCINSLSRWLTNARATFFFSFEMTGA